MHSNFLEKSFPFEEQFHDFSGQRRSFRISLRSRPTGDFFLEAKEVSKREGYRFEVYSAAYSEPAVGDALGVLRRKIRRTLSTRYLQLDAEGKKQLTHDELEGRITYGGLVVDGEMLTFEELRTILTVYEGFEIRMNIKGSE